ncbi:MAG TPA: hypothetical protein VHE13_00125 [Opitutus sp.]|nr:hypothetical protein [Opitutus sp.]
MTTSGGPQRQAKWRMAAVSFTALFLELMVIRWAPSVVPFIAYYANLMLLSSFLGLGIGALTGKRKWELFHWFPVLLACEIATLVLCRQVMLGQTTAEARFTTDSHTVLNTLVLIWIFTSNALVFVPLGQRIGALFDSLPRLSAYAWDLAGSLLGTLCFGLFSLKFFSPVGGLAVVMVVFLLLSPFRRWTLHAPVFAAILVLVFWQSDRAAIWSPYHYITISRLETPGVIESDPPPNLRTMVNPPAYAVKINQFFYHFDASFNPARYTPESSKMEAFVPLWSQYYRLPYALTKGRDRVVVLGAGGGGDVQAALAAGVRHVDAVDIDPGVIQVARRFNADAPYADPRVTVHIDDARSYLAKAEPGCDLVVYGFLDSQALFSSMSTVRLDGYVYTVEGVRAAYRLLNENGLLLLSYYATKDWLGPKLRQMVLEATGRAPVMYFVDRTTILCVPKGEGVTFPDRVFQYRRFEFLPEPLKAALAQMDLPHDDWPFLYLIRRTIPPDYLVAIGSLLALSVLAILGLRGRSFGAGDLHFGLMGMGFLLLETKGIGDCTLYFGATWFVTLVVVAGVLLMVMAANQLAERLRGFSFGLYVPLLLVLALLLAVPRDAILALPLGGRLMWSLLVVPLPVFFAGLIFSTTFRESAQPSAAIGANLIGAMVGGFCEYLAMAIGSHRLALLVIVAYLGSLLTMRALRRRNLAL